jgi:glycolate oxidase subunit GlcD
MSVTIEAAALLAHLPAALPISSLNQALAAHGLCLPIFPLRRDVSVGDLLATNSGGRLRLRYGPIGRYIRAATTVDGLQLGGPTLKRATGYGLQRALAGSAIDLGPLDRLTVSLRPLPTARRVMTVSGPLSLLLAAAHDLLNARLAVAALAYRPQLLLIELIEHSEVLLRQTAEITTIMRRHGLSTTAADDSAWQPFEALAAAHSAAPAARRLDLTLPRRLLPTMLTALAAAAATHNITIAPWGDVGLGSLHLQLPADAPADLCQELRQAAQRCNAQPLYEFGPPPPPAIDSINVAVPHAAPVDDRSFAAALAPLLDARGLLIRHDDLLVYAQDASIAQADGLAAVAALPNVPTQIPAIVRAAAAARRPITARGAGSGLAGGSIPSHGGLLLGLNRLERLVIDREQQVAHVGAGVVTAELQRAAEAVGLFYPPDPSSLSCSTIGGNLACNAGGPRCLKYGVTADYVLSIDAVLADGTPISFGDGLVGQAPGNGLAQLLVGSEGTLAVIVGATLRLIALPAARRTTLALFDSLDAACATVEQIMASGLIPAGLELMDDTTIAAVEAYLKLGLPRDTGAMLLLLADGEPESVAEESAALAALARRGGAHRVETAADARHEAQLWAARRAIAPALTRIRPNRLGEDITVPLPRIAATVRRIKQVSRDFDLPIVVFGHAGDGNLHPNILFDANDPAEAARLWPCAEAVFAAALAEGGTLSGEHGIGTLKRPFMSDALGQRQIVVQQALRQRFDPLYLLNPGKVLPSA